jgi:hypothetical protein
MRRADLDERADLRGRVREGDGVRRRAGVVGLVLAVLLAHRDRGAQPRAEQGADLLERRRDGGGGDVVHGVTGSVAGPPSTIARDPRRATPALSAVRAAANNQTLSLWG